MSSVPPDYTQNYLLDDTIKNDEIIYNNRKYNIRKKEYVK